jgi:hypothetical protein
MIDYTAKRYANKFENPDKKGNTLRKYNLPKLTSEDIENLKIGLHGRNRENYPLINLLTAVSDGSHRETFFKVLKAR